MAGILVHMVLRWDLFQRHLDPDGFGIDGGIGEFIAILDRIFSNASETLHHGYIIGHANEATGLLGSEITGLHHQCIPFPVPYRVAVPVIEIPGEIVTAEFDDARIMTDFGMNEYIIAVLHNLVVGVVGNDAGQ